MAVVAREWGDGGADLGGSADVAFVHGSGQVPSGIVVEWDFNGDGLFGPDDDITGFLDEGESFTGRDWPSQLQGKAGPGQLRLRLWNTDDRFSYFNSSSPLNQGGNSLDPGRLIRVRTDDATDVDPVLLVRDQFTGTGAISVDELGNTWEHQTPGVFARVNGDAVAPAAGQEYLMVIDASEADYYVQATIAEAGDHVDPVAGLQEADEVRLIYRWQDTSNYSYLGFTQSNSGLGGVGSQQNAIEGVDVVAGTPTSIFGPFVDVGGVTSGATDAAGDHRRRVTIGVQAAGSVVHYYVNGARVTVTNETGLQLDETHVGLYAYYGPGNRAPAIDEIAVWDRFPSSTEGVIWTGTVVDVFPEAPVDGPKTATVTAEGAMARLGQADVQPQAWAGQMRTGVAMGDVLQRAGLLYPPGLIAEGDITAGSSTDTEIGALTHCRKLEEVEAGFLHEAPEGWLVFEDRTHRDALTTQAVFSDAPGAQFGYHDFKLLQWRRELINKVTAGVSYGGPNLEVVGGVESGANPSGVTTVVDWPIPTVVIDPGDLFVVFITSTIADDSENWLVPRFWVRHRDTGASASKRTQVYSKICDGAEGGTTVTFYSDSASAGGSFLIIWYQIRDWYGTHEGIEIGPWSLGSGFAGADPETILPSWGDINPSAFLAQRAGTNEAGAGSITNPTYPLGYVNTISHFRDGNTNIHDCGMQACHKLAMTAIEDPSNFSGFAGLQNAETSVVAVRGRNGSPPEPRGRLRVTVEDQASQRRHNVVATYDGTDLFPDEDTATEWCDLMLARYANVRPIVRISFTASKSASYRAQAYKRRLGDKIRVVATQGTGMGIDADFHIESIRHRWSNGGTLWVTEWELSPA